MKVKKLLNSLDKIAPFFLQEEYDNSGIQFADLEAPVKKILLCLDVTEEILDEAMKNKVNLIISHHPLLFSSLKQITKQKNPLLYQVTTRQINLIAMHTNYDLAEGGLNDYVAQLLGIRKIAPLQRSGEKVFKFAVYVPVKYVDEVSQALFNAGAGKIGNYTETSFNISGQGTFRPMEGTHPFIGKIGEKETVSEIKVETVVSERNLKTAVQAMKGAHPYEEPAYDIYEISGRRGFGIGLWGKVDNVWQLEEFTRWVKDKLQAKYVRLIKSNDRKIQKVALCTGGGSSLIENVSNLDIDLYITGDITHHHALRAKELKLNILEIEHFDTEKFFVEAIYDQLVKLGIPKGILIKSKKMSSPYKIL